MEIAQQAAVLRGIRETAMGSILPVILRPPETQEPGVTESESKPYDFPDGTRSYILVEYLSQGVFVRNAGQLHKVWNPLISEYDIYDGEIDKATLNITIGSKDEAHIRSYAQSLEHDIHQYKLGLDKSTDRIWIGPQEVMAVRDLGGHMDPVLRHYVHRFLIEVQLEYEVSWRKVGPVIKTITNTMEIPGKRIRESLNYAASATDEYTMRAPVLVPLPAYMALAADIDTLTLSAYMMLEELEYH